MNKPGMLHSTNSTNLADLLERVLDKGVVVAGDIKIKLVEIELLTIQIRLVICSVERAIQMGMDWWQRDPNLSSLAAPQPPQALPPGQREELFERPPLYKRSASAPLSPPFSARARTPSQAPSQAPATAQTEALEKRLRDMEATLERMEARLKAKDPGDPEPSR